jgi:hypothetical protein
MGSVTHNLLHRKAVHTGPVREFLRKGASLDESLEESKKGKKRRIASGVFPRVQIVCISPEVQII